MKIKKSHVIVIGSGSSIKKYWNKIDSYIKNNNCITFGCNNINRIFIPDYHFWGSSKRWMRFGKLIDKKSKFVFPQEWSEKLIHKHYKGDVIKFEYCKNKKFAYKNKIMYGDIQNIGMWAIFFAYTRGASKVSVVGIDGYTLYSKQELDDKIESQHCFGNGHSIGIGLRKKDSKGKTKHDFADSKNRDNINYKNLIGLHKYLKKTYGFSFEIITPTIFKEFYNSSVLAI